MAPRGRPRDGTKPPKSHGRSKSPPNSRSFEGQYGGEMLVLEVEMELRVTVERELEILVVTLRGGNNSD